MEKNKKNKVGEITEVIAAIQLALTSMLLAIMIVLHGLMLNAWVIGFFVLVTITMTMKNNNTIRKTAAIAALLIVGMNFPSSLPNVEITQALYFAISSISFYGMVKNEKIWWHFSKEGEHQKSLELVIEN